ncbi:MAG: hypothetical protein IJ368_09365 [Oscillospiraceae bacterium]|nr:hypothetical protein [Oscillospiraceae bacterium]
MEKQNEKKWSFSDGLVRHNPVFAAGMAIAPAIFAANTLSGALTYAAMFSAVTFCALMIASFVPKKLPYAVRIIMYTACAAVVYIPCYDLFDGRLPSELSKLGVFLPMIVTGSFIVSSAELRFFRMKRARMTADIISHIIGFDAAIIFLGTVRELFATGGINGELYGVNTVVPLLNTPCGGFILIGIGGAFLRYLRR